MRNVALILVAFLTFNLSFAQDAKKLLNEVSAKVKTYDNIFIDFKWTLNNAKEKVAEIQTKTPNIDNMKYGELKIGDIAPGLAIAGIAGAYLIYKFFKSLTYTNHKIKQLEIKVKEYPELKPKLEKLYKNKEEIQKKLRIENNNFIEKSKLMKAKIAELEKSKSPDKEEIANLKIKLEKRMKFINKIGAKI